MASLVFSDLFHPRVPGAFHLLGSFAQSESYVVGRLNGDHYRLWPVAPDELQYLAGEYGVIDVTLGSYERFAQRDIEQDRASFSVKRPIDYPFFQRVRPLDEPIMAGFERAAFVVEDKDRRLCLFTQTVGSIIEPSPDVRWRAAPDLFLAYIAPNIRFARRDYKPG